jgi:Leucine-rich repeat (LRR) protein
LVKAQQVDCEEIQSRRIADIGDELLQVCRMDLAIVIDTNSFTLSSEVNQDVTEIYASGNHNIDFLPNNIYEKFPNILSLSFRSCNLNSVTNENFQKLFSMKRLDLAGNTIEAISDNAFSDLTNLRYLHLHYNNIIKMSGEGISSKSVQRFRNKSFNYF